MHANASVSPLTHILNDLAETIEKCIFYIKGIEKEDIKLNATGTVYVKVAEAHPGGLTDEKKPGQFTWLARSGMNGATAKFSFSQLLG